MPAWIEVLVQVDSVEDVRDELFDQGQGLDGLFEGKMFLQAL